MPLINQPFVRLVDELGLPHSGAVAYFYTSGTTTEQVVYTDSTLSTPHQYPVVADAYGVFPSMYSDPAITLKVVFKTAAGDLLDTIDPLSGGSAIGTDDLLSGAVTTDKLADESVTGTKLAAQSVSNTNLVNMPAYTVKGNATATSAAVTDMTAANIWAVLAQSNVGKNKALGRVGHWTIAAFDKADDDLMLVCDGRSLLRASYPDLFAAIGTTWGSVDGTHFTLPPAGYYLVGSGGGLDDALAVGQIVQDQFQGHWHDYITDAAGGSTGAPSNVTALPTGTIGSKVIQNPSNDGVNGAPRTGKTTRPRSIGGKLMIYY